MSAICVESPVAARITWKMWQPWGKVGEKEDVDELDGFTQHFLIYYGSVIFAYTQGSLGYVSVLVVWFMSSPEARIR